jgi:tetratricopeptide (TPR) repeat protein
VLLALSPQLDQRDAVRARQLAELARSLDQTSTYPWFAIAASWLSAGDFDSCVRALQHANEMTGSGTYYFTMADQAYAEVMLAAAHGRLGNQAQARHYLSKAHQSIATRRRVDAVLRALLTETEALMGTSVAQDALMLARRGDWNRAASLFAVTAQQPSNDELPLLRLAGLQLYLGDHLAYKATCQELMRRFPHPRDPFSIDRIARVCALAPGAVENFAVIETMTSAQPDLELTGQWFLEWYGLSRGLIEYRANRWDTAIEWLKKCRPDVVANDSPPSVVARSVATRAILAMAYHRQGRASLADEQLALSKDLANKRAPDFATAPEEDADADWAWYNWIHAWIMLREAEMVLSQTEEPSASPPVN